MKRYLKPVLALAVLSVAVYAAQILIFHDPGTTFFYILQDVAFLPVSIAIATIIVGGIIDDREREQRLERMNMLASTFFSVVGAQLTRDIARATTTDRGLRRDILTGAQLDDLAALQSRIRTARMDIDLTRETYETVRKTIRDNQMNLLVLTSNPALLEHDDLHELLTGIFHLNDEFDLRGDWDGLTDADRRHLEEDFVAVFRLLLSNWAATVRYQRENFPNFYAATEQRALTLLREREECEASNSERRA